MKLNKLDITMPNGKYAILAEKPTPLPNRSICLLSALGEEVDYSLWLAELSDDKKELHLWPYEGDDSKDLMLEMMEDFVATAFDDDE